MLFHGLFRSLPFPDLFCIHLNASRNNAPIKYINAHLRVNCSRNYGILRNSATPPSPPLRYIVTVGICICIYKWTQFLRKYQYQPTRTDTKLLSGSVCSFITLTKLCNQVCIHGTPSTPVTQKLYVSAFIALPWMGKCILSALCEPLAHPKDTFSYKINTKLRSYRFRSYSAICSRIIQLIF